MASGTAQNGPYSAQCAQWDEILLKVELGSNNAPISRDINLFIFISRNDVVKKLVDFEDKD